MDPCERWIIFCTFDEAKPQAKVSTLVRTAHVHQLLSRKWFSGKSLT